MYDKAVNACLPVLKFVPDCFVMNKMLEKLDVVFSNDDKIFVNAGSDNVTFIGDYMGLIRIYLSNVNVDDDNFGNDDPEKGC